MDIILLIGFSYALHRMAIDHNITPWKWIVRYTSVYMLSMFALILAFVQIYGPGILKDLNSMEKTINPFAPYIWLYEFILFYLFRLQIAKYVQALDRIDKDNNKFPDPPTKNKDKDNSKEQKDFSYFR